MRRIVLLLFFGKIIFGQTKWIVYKDTLFIGEPIIPILCYKNNTPFPKKVIDDPPSIYSFYTIFDGNKYMKPQQISMLKVELDTITIFPDESVYIIGRPLFYRDFRLLESTGINYQISLPFKYGKFTIYIPSRFFEEGMDSITVYFKEPPKDKKEFFEFIKHFAYLDGDFEELKKLVEKYKDTLLFPFVFFVWATQVRWMEIIGGKAKLIDGKKVVSQIEERLAKMKEKFPHHILTQENEFYLARVAYSFGLNERYYLLYKELKKKYPHNYEIKRMENKVKKLERK